MAVSWPKGQLPQSTVDYAAVGHHRRPDRASPRARQGMLGSDHEGERANAAGLVEEVRRRLGLTWVEVMAPR